MRWKDAIDRSNQDKAALVIKQGGLTVGTIIVEYFGDDLLKLEVNRGGRQWETYACNPGADFVRHLQQLLPNALSLGNNWEPV